MGIFEVFYAPGRLFQSLPERKGAWILPFLLNIVLVCAISAVTIHYIGIENILRQQFEGTRMTPEQINLVVSKAAAAPAWRNYLNATIGAALSPLLIAGAIYAFALMANKQARFVDQFAMVCYAYLPYYVVSCLMTALILAAAPDPSSLNVRNLIATNVGAFLDREHVSKGVYSLATSLDLLSFAEIFLLSLGFAKVNRTKFAFGLGAILGLWVLYVCVKLAISSLF